MAPQPLRFMFRAPPQGGSIVYVSSITAFTPGAPLGMYAVSKTALVGLTKALAQELAPRGIRVNCIAPGERTLRPRPTVDADPCHLPPSSCRASADNPVNDLWLGVLTCLTDEAHVHQQARVSEWPRHLLLQAMCRRTSRRLWWSRRRSGRSRRQPPCSGDSARQRTWRPPSHTSPARTLHT